MSKKHPIIAVTGSSGVRRDRVRAIFSQCLRRGGWSAAYVDGDSFHRYERTEMRQKIAEERAKGNPYFSHFGLAANQLDELEKLYRTYGESGTGQRRFYLHDEEEAAEYSDLGLLPGQFTPLEPIPEGTDLLLYEGLHGWVKNKEINLQPYVDLKIGVVPVMNLEWIKKLHRDTERRGYSIEEVVENILSRMPDYTSVIMPQFRRSDVNFQRVPVVDTSDPLIAREVPDEDETVLVVRFRKPEEFEVDFPFLLRNLSGSWMSRRNTMVIPGGKLELAIQHILTPMIERLMRGRG
jgi:phosphoribulokinase